MEDALFDAGRLYAHRLMHWLDQVIYEHGVYLFMAFTFLCLVAIGWLLSRPRKGPPPVPLSPQKCAIIATILASPDMTTDADGGLIRLLTGKTPSRQNRDPGYDPF